MHAILQMFSPDLASYYALHMLAGFLLSFLLDKHVELDFPDFASCILYSDISAFHWEIDRCAWSLRFHSEDNEPWSLPCRLAPLKSFCSYFTIAFPFLPLPTLPSTHMKIVIFSWDEIVKCDGIMSTTFYPLIWRIVFTSWWSWESQKEVCVLGKPSSGNDRQFWEKILSAWSRKTPGHFILQEEGIMTTIPNETPIQGIDVSDNENVTAC